MLNNFVLHNKLPISQDKNFSDDGYEKSGKKDYSRPKTRGDVDQLLPNVGC